jgi:hypothetical protein
MRYPRKWFGHDDFIPNHFQIIPPFGAKNSRYWQCVTTTQCQASVAEARPSRIGLHQTLNVSSLIMICLTFSISIDCSIEFSPNYRQFNPYFLVVTFVILVGHCSSVVWLGISIDCSVESSPNYRQFHPCFLVVTLVILVGHCSSVVCSDVSIDCFVEFSPNYREFQPCFLVVTFVILVGHCSPSVTAVGLGRT